MEVHVKSIHDPPSPDDGLRVLLEGDSAAAVGRSVGLRLPGLAPSRSLAAWFGDDPSRWEEFRIQYMAELRGNPHLRRLAEEAEGRTLTLLASSPDPGRSAAEVVRGLLRGR